jgi:uncharacterized phage-associated protein
MTEVSAHDVAREIRDRLPGVGDVVVQKLLYYCQGWHAAWTGLPMFSELIEAWSMGPVIADVWHDVNKGRPLPPPRDLDAEALGTVGYVVARYGHLYGKDLIKLTHAEAPWLDASQNDWVQNPTITVKALITFFRGEQSDTDELARAALLDPEYQAFAETAKKRTTSTGAPDDPARIRERIASLR